MNTKLTPWFPAEVKPARMGVYGTRFLHVSIGPFETFQHWNGAYWGAYASDQGLARKNRDSPSKYQSPEWRGLAKKP